MKNRTQGSQAMDRRMHAALNCIATNSKLMIIMIGSFIFGCQLTLFLIHHRHHGAANDSFTLFSGPIKESRWPSSSSFNTQKSQPGWDNGCRSIDFFEGELRPHDWERNYPKGYVLFFGDGQDKAVIEMLNRKRGGTFVDLASNHATERSNTYALERSFGWTGICIEANPNFLDGLASMRTCQVVVGVVGSGNHRMEPVEFALGRDAGGLGHSGLGGIIGDGLRNTQSKNIGKVTKFFTVPLEEVLDRYDAPVIIDYLSLDVEGAEFLIMEYFPFHRWRFRIITVERPVKELMDLLHINGYMIIKKIWPDVLYVHKSVLEEVNFSAIEVDGPYENQAENDWQLIPPVRHGKK